MNLLFLFIAAAFEAGGDAVVRSGRLSAAIPTRIAFFVAGAAVLFVYGYLVNRPGFSFGRALGVYVFFFFVIAQVMSWAFFHEPPGRGALAGGVAFAIGAALVYFVR